MRSYMRERNLGGEGDESIAESVGLSGDELYALYRLLAIAKYEDRYVIPKAHAEVGRELEELGCSLDYAGGPGAYASSGPFGEASGRPVPVAVENFHALQARQTTEGTVDAGDGAAKVNLLNWDGRGAVPLGMPGIRRTDPDMDRPDAPHGGVR
jgi:nitrate reductase beta subunit